ncbi:glycosyltransferase [Nitrosomonas nitrosa]|uniref:glycosyltransferase n=1 Tax=Nitrosomonas nitrosa TaxID=52442 RepID=UPI0023F7D60D|nr:glycosyltransferase [Nitrosomonas nitrosa]MCO6433790.1 glycosyltransferase [Nitrosomonas nitrosa]
MMIHNSFDPLVSCIMPTCNRREFIPRAIEYFLRQDYPNKELIILDDGEDCVADLIPPDPRICYFQDKNRQKVGAKRNWLCEQARGEIIVHWDDDDWSAPNRVSLQVDAICREEADICGLNRILFLAADTQSAWEYVYAGRDARWVCGSSLCYTKIFWGRNRFPDINDGEDTRFVRADRTARIAVMPDNGFLIALTHECNTSPRRTFSRVWEARNQKLIQDLMGNDWAYYFAGVSKHHEPVGDKRTEIQRLPPMFNMEESCKVSIGIHVTDDGERLLNSWAAISAHTSIQFEGLLLADGVDESTESAIAQLTQFRRIGFEARRGAPACFNLLAREGTGNILVFIESGALPGPGWLESLIHALSQNPTNGLAGPSTNRSWNMQCVFPRAKSSDISATARAAQSQFAHAVRTMEPLYCLADFCYAVRREVVETIGAADETYGEGPCWEMDYSVRAARAGWRPVWAQSAYVYRMPLTPRRVQREAAKFEANRHRYQDKFCARQLRGNSGGYNTHCRGEECHNFAPREQITILIPLDKKSPLQTTSVCVSAETNSKLLQQALSPSNPLVSCIMPTYNRRSFIQLALQCFDAQDYEPKELVIVDDGDDSIEDLVKDHPLVQYRRLSGRHSIGAKRNIACELAKGTIVVLWDDDDWYGADRIAEQVKPILSGNAQITGLETRWILDLNSREFWTLSDALHQRMFMGNIAGGTMAFERVVWEHGNRFQNINLAEDACFIRQAQGSGIRISRISNENLFVYMRHGRNSWKFKAGHFVEAQGWQRIEPPVDFDASLVESYMKAMIQFNARYAETV